MQQPFTCRLMPSLRYGDHPRQQLDLYLPMETGRPTPLIVLIHGGGWTAGARGPLAGEALFVRHGFAVARIEYRYATQAPHPAQIDDCRAALDLLRRDADALGIDPGQVVVMGHSAGGHLASLLACTTPGVCAAVNLAGPTDLRHAYACALAGGEAEQWKLDVFRVLLGGDPEQRQDAARSASPLAWISPTTPPHLLLFGTADDVVAVTEGERFHAAMQAAGRPSELVLLPGAGHVDPAFFNESTLLRLLAFFRQHLATGHE